MNNRIGNILLAVLYSCCCFGQMDEYNYAQPIIGVGDEWHKIVLPENIYSNVKPNLQDIRIYGVTSIGDTVEAPYLMKILDDKTSLEKVPYRRINNSKGVEGYFVTFMLENQRPINRIELDFKTQNFDWNINLEGSMDQKEWFTILSDYRILSIRNTSTKYKFADLIMPEMKYKYYRLFIPNNFDPGLNTASISRFVKNLGVYSEQERQRWLNTENESKKSTELKIELPNKQPISRVEIKIEDKFDYYRPLQIQYLKDSIKTDKGWKYNYITLESSTLTSLSSGVYDFKPTVAKELRLVVNDGDNQPLKVHSVQASGPQYELVVRLNEKAKYFLAYGNKKALFPQYDIQRFAANIPEDVKTLDLGEVQILQAPPQNSEPIIQSKLWLWLVIGLAVLVMGWFTIGMMREKK